jgi:cytoskeleton protein RodZ
VSIGQQLATARTEAGLTVEQVSDATRIRQTIISAIENDDFSRSGGDFYARAHIRGIAGVVGIDPAPLLAEFDTTVAEEASPSASAVFESETNAPAERRGPNWSAAMAAALVVLLAIAGFQLFTGDDDGPRSTETIAGDVTSPGAGDPAAPVDPDQRTAAPPGTAGDGGAQDTAGTPGPDGDAIAQKPRDRVTVELEVDEDTSWVSVTNAGGRTLFSGLLDEGATRSWSDREELRMVIGNAGAVSLVVNGQDVGSPGAPGEVARVEFTPDDPENA